LSIRRERKGINNYYKDKGASINLVGTCAISLKALRNTRVSFKEKTLGEPNVKG